MKPTRWLFAPGFLAILAVLWGYHLMSTRLGITDYRDQHVGTALLYAKGSIDLLHPIIVGFNANNAPYPLEFPIWQATAALFFKAFGTWFGWANLTSLLFFTTGLWPLYQLGRAYINERGAWWTLLFYCAQPIVFYISGRGGTDSSCQVFALWFIYFADKLVKTGQWSYWFPAAAFGIMAAITKLPFFFCTGVASFLLLLVHGRKSGRRWLQLSTVGILAGIIFALWQHHSDTSFAKGEFNLSTNIGDEVKGTPAESLYTWTFGTWAYRMDPKNWFHGAWRFAGTVFGSFVLAGLAFWSLFYSRNRAGQFLLAGAVVTTLVFTHLVLHHHHYYYMYSAGVALLCGTTMAKLDDLIALKRNRDQLIYIGVASALLLASTLQGLIWMNAVLDTDPYPRQMASIIRQHTSENDKLLIQGGGWGGEAFILSDRQGLSIWDTRFLEDPKNLERIKSLGYTKLVMISATPLLNAVQITKPGRHDLKRESYEQHITAIAKDWPSVFQNEDILIKEIPR